MTLLIIMAMLALSVAAPFIALYAVSSIKRKDYQTHIKIQKRLFLACILGVIILELQIRVSGGSGSLVAGGTYANMPFFKPLLIAHIVGAVLTYMIWALQVFTASKMMKTAGRVPLMHKRIGQATVVGLFYTAVTALMVCTLAFFL